MPGTRREPYLFATIGALGLVAALWGGCFLLVGVTLGGKRASSIGEFGQFGDTFGSVNALFTGFAFVGLVYTALLQRRQSRIQAGDSRRDRLALRRQAAEQHLTARLNATLAMLQAVDLKAQLIPSRPPEFSDAFEKDEYRVEAEELRQKLAILLQESRMGFEREWNIGVERKAVRSHLLDLFIHWFSAIQEAPSESRRASKAMRIRSELTPQIWILSTVIRNDHILISDWIRRRIADLHTSLRREKNARDVAALSPESNARDVAALSLHWLAESLLTLEDSSSKVWGDAGQDARAGFLESARSYLGSDEPAA